MAGFRGILRAVAFALALGAAGLAAAQTPTSASATVRRVADLSVDELLKAVEQEHPVAMFVLARRLLDVGRNDEAVFWFYEGQLRWRAYLFEHPELGGSGGVLSETEGDQFARWFNALREPLNAWAVGDFEGMLATYQAVLDWDSGHPDPLTPAGEAKDRSREGLKELAAWARENRARLVGDTPQRRAGAAPPADPYTGDGGAFGGTPGELLKPYDPARFGFRKGVTTKADVVAALGAPESWRTENGRTTLDFAFKRDMGFIGMVQIVHTSLTFDKDGRLVEIDLPGDR
ncbi:MAG: hypothetical protein ACOY4K_15310 [Pseudomonadota bacterium]